MSGTPCARARAAIVTGLRRLTRGCAAAGAAALVLAGCLAGAVAAPPPLCRHLTFGGAGYVVCEAKRDRHQIRMVLNGPDGAPWGRLGRFAASAEGAGLLMAMNGGMYRDDRAPVGLYVEDGRQLQPLNQRDGRGNFHMKPNGVFFVTATGAGVLPTPAYARAKPKALFATQSGPMLVIDGRINPKFRPDSDSLKMRNGVGVRGDTVVFAISDEPVRFHDFARLFRDGLGVSSALYLDGTVSSIYAPELGRRDWLYAVGPIIAVFPRAGAPARR